MSSKFSEVDSKNDQLVAENKILKETVADLKTKLARIEDAMKGNVNLTKTMPLKEVFKNVTAKTEKM